MAPGSVELLGSDASSSGWLAREHVPGQPAQGGQVPGGLTRPGTALAFNMNADLPVPQVSRRRWIRALRDHLGLENRPRDVLRHTAASHLLVLKQDAAAPPGWWPPGPGTGSTG